MVVGLIPPFKIATIFGPHCGVSSSAVFGGVAVGVQDDINRLYVLLRAASKIPMSVNTKITTTIRSA